jgi:hypothetical protein
VVDPGNKGRLGYDEFYTNLGGIAKLTHPEAYAIYGRCLEGGKELEMKKLFRLLGGT